MTPDQRKVYSENLEQLGLAAQRLAHIQEGKGDEDFSLLFMNHKQAAINDHIKGLKAKIEEFGGFKSKPKEKPLEKKQPTKQKEENGGENEEHATTTQANSSGDTIEVNSPDEDASIAEAKPVGLAIAGEGGIASSKPVATAVAGPHGLAVARPVATAIAGVSPSEVASLGISIPGKYKSDAAGNYKIASNLQKKFGLADDGSGLLVGPDYVRPQKVDKVRDNSEKEEIFAEEDVDSSKSPYMVNPQMVIPSFYHSAYNLGPDARPTDVGTIQIDDLASESRNLPLYVRNPTLYGA